ALHGAAAHALRAGFTVAGIVGLTAGLLALLLMRPQRVAPAIDQQPVPAHA
ncbi:hypothetical protein GTX23_13560, partial [Streptomyces sp. SID6139]|nr:hypothetical protein [Streptomyces sp. SID6139]